MDENFAVILVAGLAVFGLFWIASNAPGFGSQPSEMTFVDRQPGQIGEAQPDSHSFEFGTFTVGEGRGEIEAFSAERETVSNGIFGGRAIIFGYNATAPKDGEVTFEVLGKQGEGAFYVEVNDEVIFEEKLVTTSTPEVTIPADALEPGINSFKIGTRKGGVFSSTKYAVEDLEVSVDDRKFHDREDSFTLVEPWVDNFASAELTFTIPMGSTTPTQPLEVSINDNTLFSREVSRSDQSVNVTLQNADLTPGMNTVKFETEGEARYKLENTGLTLRYIGHVSPGDYTHDFSMNSTQLNFAGRQGTQETIRFEYVNLMKESNTLEIELNSFNTTLTPSQGTHSVELPEDVLEEENSLTISSEGAYSLKKLDIASREAETS